MGQNPKGTAQAKVETHKYCCVICENLKTASVPAFLSSAGFLGRWTVTKKLENFCCGLA
jgi:hypothetical protein